MAHIFTTLEERLAENSTFDSNAGECHHARGKHPLCHPEQASPRYMIVFPVKK
jgi:hypothetical protein